MFSLKRAGLILIIMAAVALTGGCAASKKNTANYWVYNGDRPKKIGVVLAAPGKSDPGANEAVIAGAKKAAAELDTEYKILAPGDLVNNEESLSYLAENNYDMVVAVGPRMAEELDRVAPNYPDIKFVIFDGEVDRPNVACVKVLEEDGAFLAGVEAASLTKSNVVGFVGGPMISAKNLESSFVQGVQYVNMTEGKKVKVNAAYAGLTEISAMNPEKGKNLAGAMYAAGTDVVFSSAIGASSGVVAAATENKKIAIAGDIQLMNASPWSVHGSFVKKPESVIFDTARKTLSGKFTAGRNGYGLAEGALDFAVSAAVAPETAAKLASIKDQLKKGLIKPYSIQIPAGTVMKFPPAAPPVANQPGAGQPGAVQPGTGQPVTGQTGAKQPPKASSGNKKPGGTSSGGTGTGTDGTGGTGGTGSGGTEQGTGSGTTSGGTGGTTTNPGTKTPPPTSTSPPPGTNPTT